MCLIWSNGSSLSHVFLALCKFIMLLRNLQVWNIFFPIEASSKTFSDNQKKDNKLNSSSCPSEDHLLLSLCTLLQSIKFEKWSVHCEVSAQHESHHTSPCQLFFQNKEGRGKKANQKHCQSFPRQVSFLPHHLSAGHL